MTINPSLLNGIIKDIHQLFMKTICEQAQTILPLEDGWTYFEFQVHSQPVRIAIPVDADQLLDTTEIDPYSAHLWSSSQTMLSFIEAHSHQLLDQTILELGCGLGSIGIAACLCDAREVVLSDSQNQALELADAFIQANQLSDITTHQLDWHRTDVFPWINKFTRILASDILYDVSDHDAIISVINSILTQQGVVWISDPGRRTAQQFIKKANTAGWSIQLYNQMGPLTSERFQVGEWCLIEMTRP